jgi:hypothetical protein
MHRKAIFALAGVFLAIALVVPPVLLIIQAGNVLFEFTQQNNPGHQTSGNVTSIQQISQNHTNTVIITIAIEAIFVPLFAVTLYYGINHPHPHGKTNETEQET